MTYYVVAHFHYVLSMGAVFALFSAWYFWIVKILGLNYSLFWAKIHFVVLFVGVNVTFFPQHFLGLQGMPRRISDFADAFSGWNMVSSIGSMVSVIATIIFLGLVYFQLTEGKSATRFPWLTPEFNSDFLQTLLNRRASSLEWALDSPVKQHAYGSLPVQASVSCNELPTAVFLLVVNKIGISLTINISLPDIITGLINIKIPEGVLTSVLASTLAISVIAPLVQEFIRPETVIDSTPVIEESLKFDFHELLKPENIKLLTPQFNFNTPSWIHEMLKPENLRPMLHLDSTPLTVFLSQNLDNGGNDDIFALYDHSALNDLIRLHQAVVSAYNHLVYELNYINRVIEHMGDLLNNSYDILITGSRVDTSEGPISLREIIDNIRDSIQDFASTSEEATNFLQQAQITAVSLRDQGETPIDVENIPQQAEISPRYYEPIPDSYVEQEEEDVEQEDVEQEDVEQEDVEQEDVEQEDVEQEDIEMESFSDGDNLYD